MFQCLVFEYCLHCLVFKCGLLLLAFKFVLKSLVFKRGLQFSIFICYIDCLVFKCGFSVWFLYVVSVFGIYMWFQCLVFICGFSVWYLYVVTVFVVWYLSVIFITCCSNNTKEDSSKHSRLDVFKVCFIVRFVCVDIGGIVDITVHILWLTLKYNNT